jgi:hypothetical protein
MERRKAMSSSTSTPSAPTLRPSSLASATMERSIVPPLPFCPRACTKARSTLMVSKANWLT